MGIDALNDDFLTFYFLLKCWLLQYLIKRIEFGKALPGAISYQTGLN